MLGSSCSRSRMLNFPLRCRAVWKGMEGATPAASVNDESSHQTVHSSCSQLGEKRDATLYLNHCIPNGRGPFLADSVIGCADLSLQLLRGLTKEPPRLQLRHVRHIAAWQQRLHGETASKSQMRIISASPPTSCSRFLSQEHSL